MAVDNLHVLEQFALALVLVDPGSLRIVSANAPAEALCGLASAELAARPLQQLLPHLDTATLRQRLAAAGPETAFALTLPARLLAHQSGSRRTVDLTLRTIALDGRCLLAVLIQDASARQSAIDQAHNVLRATQLGYWDWDIEADRLSVDQRWRDIFAHNQNLPLSQFEHAIGVIHPEDASQVRERFLN